MKDLIIYLTAFIMTMVTAYLGERKTKVDEPRDYEEFRGRMLVVLLSLFFFIAYQLLFRWFFSIHN